jgi:cephalosporin hydroxylase
MSVPAILPDVKPLTVVDVGLMPTVHEMADRIASTRAEHGPLLQDFHEVFYSAPHTWHFNSFMGVGLMKIPNDLWMYQILISETRPKYIIETGTYQGASALWFAFLQDLLGIEGGRVFTIDFEDHRRCSHPRITFLGGDSRDSLLAAAIAAELDDTSPRLISLDADHSADHVRRELELYAPLVRVGEYLVVEDTNISWSGPGGDRGAAGGVQDYVSRHQGEFIQDILCERWLTTMHPGGWLRRVAECPHGA